MQPEEINGLDLSILIVFVLFKRPYVVLLYSHTFCIVSLSIGVTGAILFFFVNHVIHYKAKLCMSGSSAGRGSFNLGLSSQACSWWSCLFQQLFGWLARRFSRVQSWLRMMTFLHLTPQVLKGMSWTTSGHALRTMPSRVSNTKHLVCTGSS